MNKNGLSTIVAMVILVAISVTIASVLFLFGINFVSRLSPPIDCSDITFEAEIYEQGWEYFLNIVNKGDIEIKGFVVKSIRNGEINIERELNLNVKIGETESVKTEFINEGNKDDRFLIVPKILIKNDNGEDVMRVCDDNNGYEAQFREITVFP